MPKIVALLTDYGTRDQYAGSLRGAVLAACPDAQVVDISHDISRHAIREAAFVLRASVTAFPAGTAFVAVVDPGVGTNRRGIAVRAGGYFFVGPDNGIFSFILIDHPEAEVRELTNAGLFRSNVATTFHGRDVFGPVAGALVAGHRLRGCRPEGRGCFPFRVSRSPSFVEDGALEGHVIYVDVFGNLVSTLGGEAWETLLQGVGGDLTEIVAEVNRVVVPVVSTFGDVPEDDACAYLGSAGRIEIAVNQGSAAERFEAVIGSRWLTPPRTRQPRSSPSALAARSSCPSIWLHRCERPSAVTAAGLSSLSAADLGVHAVKAVLERTGVDPRSVTEAIIGCARQAGGGPNVARQISFRAGLGETVPAMTMNMACGSGLKAIDLAFRAVRDGDAEAVLAGGTESMSRVPYLLTSARWGSEDGSAGSHRRHVQGRLRLPDRGHADGRDRRAPGRDPLHLARGAGRFRSALAAAGRAGPGRRAIRFADRRGRGPGGQGAPR